MKKIIVLTLVLLLSVVFNSIGIAAPEFGSNDRNNYLRVLSVPVSSVEGKTVLRATRSILRKGLRVGKVTRQASRSKLGSVIKQHPSAGTKVAIGSKINLVIASPYPSFPVSIDPQQITVYQGEPAKFTAKTTQRIDKLEFTWSISNLLPKGKSKDFTILTHRLNPGKYAATLEVNVALKNAPNAGSVPTKYYSILIVKAREPITVYVPDVKGFTEDPAKIKISNADLRVGIITKVPVKTGKNNIVLKQKPRPDRIVTKGSTVDIWVTDLKRPPLSVSITPKNMSVYKGEVATFRAITSPDDIKLFWDGAGMRVGDKEIRIPTKNLQTKKYSINLTGTDPYTRKSKKDSAVLEVKPRLVHVPDLVGQRVWDAETILVENKNLSLGQVTYKELTRGRNKIVLSQDPKANSLVNIGTSVDIVVSKLIPRFWVIIQPETLVVTQGKPAHFEAKASTNNTVLNWEWSGLSANANNDKRLKINTNNLNPGTYPIYLNAKDQHLQKASDKAKLIIEERLISVPDLIGMLQEDAISLLKNNARNPEQQLTVGNIKLVTVENGKDKIVIRQTPDPGDRVKKWTRIDLDVTELKPPLLSVNIIEDRVSVFKGEEAIFRSKTSPDNMNLSWTGVGYPSREKVFKIDTEKLLIKNSLLSR